MNQRATVPRRRPPRPTTRHSPSKKGAAAFTFEDGSREKITQPRGIWIDLKFDPSNGNEAGDLEAKLIAENGVHSVSIPIYARVARLAIEFEVIDTLPLLVGEASDLYRLRITNNGSSEEKIHLPGAIEPYNASQNDFALAAHATETVTVSAKINDSTHAYSSFNSAIEIDRCPAMSPTTKKNVPDNWGYMALSASSAPLVVATVSGAGTYATADIDLGAVHCGKGADPQSLEIQNLTHTALDVSLSFAKGGASPYSLSTSSVHLEARSRAPLTITSDPIPQYPAAGDDLFNDTLAIKAAIGSRDVAIKQRAWGHRYSLSTSELNFGNVAVGASSDLTLMVRDDGYVPIAASGPLGGLAGLERFVPTQFAPPFETDSAVAVEPTKDTTMKVTFRPTAKGVASAELAFGSDANRINCSPPPVIKLSGNGN